MTTRTKTRAGLTLEQFAGVKTALAEEFPLSDVLAQERIPEARWRKAEPLWIEAIADSSELESELIQKTRIAEDCLGRRIDPLDHDPGAWVGLLGELASERGDALVRALGLKPGDVGRLGRMWRKRAEAEPDVARKLVEVAPTARAPAKVTAEPARLQPFPWTPKSRLEEKPAAPAADRSFSVDPIRPRTQAPEIAVPSYMLSAPSAPVRATLGAPSAIRPLATSPARGADSKAAGRGEETAAMPAPDEIRRLIAEAEPSFAIPRGQPPRPPSPTPVSDEPAGGETVILATRVGAPVDPGLPFGGSGSAEIHDLIGEETSMVDRDQIDAGRRLPFGPPRLHEDLRSARRAASAWTGDGPPAGETVLVSPERAAAMAQAGEIPFRGSREATSRSKAELGDLQRSPTPARVDEEDGRETIMTPRPAGIGPGHGEAGRVAPRTRVLAAADFVPSGAGARTDSGPSALVDEPLATIEEYVEALVGLASARDPQAFLRSHGLTGETWVRLSRSWSDRIRRDPQLGRIYDALVAARRDR